MKRILLVLAAVGMLGAMPAFAADHSGMKMDTSEGVMQCAVQAESIQTKIKRLEGEVAKGEKKYDTKQLNALKAKLVEANKLLDQLNKN